MSSKHKFSRMYNIDEETRFMNISTVNGYPYQYKGIRYFIHQLSNKRWEVNEYTTGLIINTKTHNSKQKARIKTKLYIDKTTPKAINKSIKNVCNLIKKHHKKDISQFLIRYKIDK